MELSARNFSTWNSKDKIAVSWTAEMRRQNLMCDASVVICVTLAGFSWSPRSVFHSSDAASRSAQVLDELLCVEAVLSCW